ncbi:MAG: phosphatase PAP2 family protein [Ignavibacteriae bacterium]|nr:phosphatase PAP2 family protein [Ignavibacteriota bacterium]
MEWLYAVDLAIFQFFNNTLANPVGDAFWPYLTDYDKRWPFRIVLVGIWLWLVGRGGKRGRTAAFMLIPLLFLSDQFSSHLIKPLVDRIRPCHVLAPDQIHLIVSCGGGLSFPSSHAVNNFGVATMFSFYYPRIKIGVYAFAFLVAISRVFVGVHYPSDALGGAIIGTVVALVVVLVWQRLSARFFPSVALERDQA